ncbi:ninjurin-2-like isoform X1 [Hermetia illucens]|uniref:ninjurin-2-like isoform X1 n=1 Tax=Hermetia illucens TaxID=343691 RepID=UPI0018CBF5E3|nr:ninjurin-2-like isoform X1 [Hermetia illucens]
MAEQEDRKESSAAVTAPTTPVISPATTPTPPATYDEEAAIGGGARQAEGANNVANNNNSNNEESSKVQQEETVGDGRDEADFNLIKILRELNLNSYATKKTIAQAILDLALLAANASQLKFILSVGEKHEFYHIILWLVVASIILQVIQAIICIILGLVLNINQVDEQKAADIVNNICLCVVVLIVAVNVIISGFDMRATDELQADFRKYT